MKSKIHEHQSTNTREVSKTNLPFDFTLDKSTKTALINREFDADLSLVWDAFTKPEILDQWWAPQPWTSKTKFMNFEVGGQRFYAMVSPEGEEHWSIQTFTSISPKTNFKMSNAFADKDEKPELPASDWDLNFSEQNGTTKVNITIYNESLARMEKMIEMGFTEGFKMSMNNLENLLATLSMSSRSKFHFALGSILSICGLSLFACILVLTDVLKTKIIFVIALPICFRGYSLTS